MSILLLITALFLAAVLLTGIVKVLAPQFQLLDLPVSRSAHSNPTPSGGGLSIVILLLLVSGYYFSIGIIPLREFMALSGGGLIAAIGLVDDFNHLHIRWRVPAQLLAAAWAVLWLGDVPAIKFGPLQLHSTWLLNGLAVVALVWLLNLYNFMDGIDGIAGSELVFVSAAALFFLIQSDDQVGVVLTATLLAAGAGFLLWNWSPAKIFMGDVGSGFIGFILGVLALLTMHHGSMTVWVWLLLLGVFVADATVTLICRFCGGCNWYEGHATHAYQKAAKLHKSHAKVTITVMMINCLWLAPLAWLSIKLPELGIYLSLVGIVPLIFVAIKLKAGKMDQS
jgi:Fuc2NAc and GlcNAc transferase